MTVAMPPNKNNLFKIYFFKSEKQSFCAEDDSNKLDNENRHENSLRSISRATSNTLLFVLHYGTLFVDNLRSVIGRLSIEKIITDLLRGNVMKRTSSLFKVI